MFRIDRLFPLAVRKRRAILIILSTIIGVLLLVTLEFEKRSIKDDNEDSIHSPFNLIELLQPDNSYFNVTNATTTPSDKGEEDVESFYFYDDMEDLHPPLFRNTEVSFSCPETVLKRTKKENKNFVVYENFVGATQTFKCQESITYTTHGDYRFLDNLIPLVNKWNGPVSIALYAPGDDLEPTLKMISYMRDCASKRIKELVSFHIFFDIAYKNREGDKDHFQWMDAIYEREQWRKCTERPDPRIKSVGTFKSKAGLLYPVNVARNLARSAATTFFVLASDIELYPSLNVIPMFFGMLAKQYGGKKDVIFYGRKVYVLPVFEVKKEIRTPMTKAVLSKLIQSGDAITFHKYICPECHKVPYFKQWASKPGSTEVLEVFRKHKRRFVPGENPYLEPIFIGTKQDPPYDERLSWEGKRDKMTQAFTMCALNYDFIILSNAFLIHRPGIKKLKSKRVKTSKVVQRQNNLINLKIKAELIRKFGKRTACFL